jgi:hypothetical protein
LKLGYNIEPTKKGRCSFYTSEQVRVFDELDAHIKAAGGMDGFRNPVIESRNEGKNGDGKVEPVRDGGEQVHTERELMANSSANLFAEEEEIYVETDPLEDIKEQQIESLHVAAQYNAATNLAALNYLTGDYMKHRKFSVAGLAEQVHKSEQAVRETFSSLMVEPEEATKKLLNKIRQRRSK